MAFSVDTAAVNETPRVFDYYRNEIAVGLPNDDETRTLRRILRGELSAVEAYEQVIDKFGHERYRVLELLRSIAEDHEDAAFDITQMLRDEGVEPESDSGAWGGIVQTVIASAGLFGEVGALRALRTGEEFGLRRYEEALNEEQVPDRREYIRHRSIPTQRLHIDRLSAFLYLQSVDKQSTH